MQNKKTEIREKISKVFEPEEIFQCDAYEYNENKQCMTYIAATNKRIIVFHETPGNTQVKIKSFDMVSDISFDDDGKLLIELNDEMLKMVDKSYYPDLDRLHAYLNPRIRQEKKKRDKRIHELNTYKKRKAKKKNAGQFIFIAGITVIATAAITLAVGFAFNGIDNFAQMFKDNKHQSELLEQQNALYQAELKLELLEEIDSSLLYMSEISAFFKDIADDAAIAATNDSQKLKKSVEEKLLAYSNSLIFTVPKNEENIKLKKSYLKDNFKKVFNSFTQNTESLLELIKTNSPSVTSYLELSNAYNDLNNEIETIRKDISIEKTAQKEYIQELTRINP